MMNTFRKTLNHAVQPQLRANNRGFQAASELLISNVSTLPKFSESQMVCFAGGVGKIKSYRYQAGTWFYTIEMDMGPEPDFGRVGSETTILLQETDILEGIFRQ